MLFRSLDPWAASTLRWLAVWFVVLGAIAVGMGFMRAAASARSARYSSVLPTVLAVGPLAAMTFYVVGVALKHSPIVGPEPASFFHHIGNAASYGVPLLVVTLTLVGYAVRERSEVFAFAGGLMGKIGRAHV